ncbi:hypothetical protein [Nostoc sp. CHAB 5715]|uniref:hypothetical protein n=1 Tax=Nostoc sp. CHAB 5715 TaxID=2780400 RepID=UPI001E31EFBE|nr:hypothetical protein [Nostoc sp. CHAB 5715]MCC5623422.1 hypothetical protein [Nostoc sp. CHAB 5715]
MLKTNEKISISHLIYFPSLKAMYTTGYAYAKSIPLPSVLEKAIAARLMRLRFSGFSNIFEFLLENKASNLD